MIFLPTFYAASTSTNQAINQGKGYFLQLSDFIETQVTNLGLHSGQVIAGEFLLIMASYLKGKQQDVIVSIGAILIVLLIFGVV